MVSASHLRATGLRSGVLQRLAALAGEWVSSVAVGSIAF